MKKLIALFLFFAIGGLLPALAGGFRTVLVDAERQPVPGAVVSFYTLPDSALVDAVTSDDEGQVAFANASPAPMMLRIQALGFLPFVDLTEAMGDTLQPARPTIIQQPGIQLQHATAPRYSVYKTSIGKRRVGGANDADYTKLENRFNR